MFHYGDQSSCLLTLTADETDFKQWLIMAFKALPAFDFQQNCSHKQPAAPAGPCTCFCYCHNQAINSLSVRGGKLKLTIHLDVRGHLIECSAGMYVCVRVCFPACSSLSVCTPVTELLILDKWQPFWTGPFSQHRLNINNACVWAYVFLPMPRERRGAFSLTERKA